MRRSAQLRRVITGDARRHHRLGTDRADRLRHKDVFAAAGVQLFLGQYGTNVPGLMAAVVLSALPVLALYLFGRRHLLSGLAAGFGK